MLSSQVDKHDALPGQLAAGVSVDPKRETHDYGKFGCFTDSEGNQAEVWQPVDAQSRTAP
jgi:hypothetical protein